MKKIIEETGMIFIDVRWYHDVGLLLVQDKITRKYKAYIGAVEDYQNTEEKDIRKLMKWGSKFEYDAARALFGKIMDTDWIENHPEYFI